MYTYHSASGLTLGYKLAQRVCVPAGDGRSNSRYNSCSNRNLHHHKAPLGDSAI